MPESIRRVIRILSDISWVFVEIRDALARYISLNNECTPLN